LGHRRWIFFPRYAEGGFGLVEGNGVWSGQWILGFGPDPNVPFVGYPPANPYPIEALLGPWSISVDGAGFSSAIIAVIRLSDGQWMPVGNIVVTPPGSGHNTLAWTVTGAEAGEEYEIRVEGVANAPQSSYIWVTHLISCR
jgi:hypothetical protein